MARFDKQKKSKNFEDRTNPVYKFIENRFYDLLENTGVAYKDLTGVREHGYPPVIRPLDPQRSDPTIYTRNWHEMELTPDEADQIDRGATHRDILLQRAYKRFPQLIGK